MKSICTIFILIAFGWFQAGCGGSSENTAVNEVPAAESSPSETPLPQFSDAAQALAVGSELLESGETDKAIDALNQAVTLDPDLAEAYFKLGVAYALVEIRDQTAAVVETEATPVSNRKKAEETKTNSEKAFEKAVEAYKKLIDKNEEDHAAHYNLGRAYNKLNEDEEAAKALKQAVKLNPDDTEYQTELGAILIKLAQYNEAVPPLKKALELDPGNLRAEELLSDAEAGRKRINYKTVTKEDKTTAKQPPAEVSNTAPKLPSPSPQPADIKQAKPKPTP